jgi:putative membrane protein
MWHGYYFGGGWWMMGLGMLFWGILIVLAVWAIARHTGSTRATGIRGHDGDPVRQLKNRLARGEIDETEYQRIRKHLEER